MTRRSVVTSDGRSFWFDDEAKSGMWWNETTTFNGNNQISDATGSQWEHERLYRTGKGAWILKHWSQWQGSRETYTEVGDAEAAAWLILCGHGDDAEELLPKEMAASEL